MAKRLVVIVMILAVICAAVSAKKEGKLELPKAVKDAIKAMWPKSEIKKAETEKKCIEFYEVEVDVNGMKTEIVTDADGIVLAVKTKEKANALPAAVAKTASKEGRIVEAEKKVVHAKYEVVKLDKPMIKYMVKVEKKNKTIELKIAEDGKILEEKKQKK